MTTLDRYHRIIKKPLITEKATDDASVRNAYHFHVLREANKVEIRQAVERLFDVKVLSVNTARTKPKWRRRGYTQGETKTWKRAMVKLREGDTIEFM